MSEVFCRTCGTSMGTDVPTPEHCGSCPPTSCEDCGGVNVWSSGDLCACWTSLEGMALADLKALFADDCEGPGLSVDVAKPPAPTRDE